MSYPYPQKEKEKNQIKSNIVTWLQHSSLEYSHTAIGSCSYSHWSLITSHTREKMAGHVKVRYKIKGLRFQNK